MIKLCPLTVEKLRELQKLGCKRIYYIAPQTYDGYNTDDETPSAPALKHIENWFEPDGSLIHIDSDGGKRKIENWLYDGIDGPYRQEDLNKNCKDRYYLGGVLHQYGHTYDTEPNGYLQLSSGPILNQLSEAPMDEQNCWVPEGSHDFHMHV